MRGVEGHQVAEIWGGRQGLPGGVTGWMGLGCCSWGRLAPKEKVRGSSVCLHLLTGQEPAIVTWTHLVHQHEPKGQHIQLVTAVHQILGSNSSIVYFLSKYLLQSYRHSSIFCNSEMLSLIISLSRFFLSPFHLWEMAAGYSDLMIILSQNSFQISHCFAPLEMNSPVHLQSLNSHTHTHLTLLNISREHSIPYD